MTWEKRDGGGDMAKAARQGCRQTQTRGPGLWWCRRGCDCPARHDVVKAVVEQWVAHRHDVVVVAITECLRPAVGDGREWLLANEGDEGVVDDEGRRDVARWME